MFLTLLLTLKLGSFSATAQCLKLFYVPPSAESLGLHYPGWYVHEGGYWELENKQVILLYRPTESSPWEVVTEEGVIAQGVLLHRWINYSSWTLGYSWFVKTKEDKRFYLQFRIVDDRYLYLFDNYLLLKREI